MNLCKKAPNPIPHLPLNNYSGMLSKGKWGIFICFTMDSYFFDRGFFEADLTDYLFPLYFLGFLRYNIFDYI